MKRAPVLIVGFALAAALAGFWAGNLMRGAPTPFSTTIVPDGEPLAADVHAIDAPDLAGELQPLRQWAGRLVLINFWATWCGPCVDEMPLLDAFAAEQGSDGIQVIGVAQDDADIVRAFLDESPVRYPILLDPPGRNDLAGRLGNRHGVLPYTVLVSPDGQVLATKAGSFTRATLEAWLESHAG